MTKISSFEMKGTIVELSGDDVKVLGRRVIVNSQEVKTLVELPVALIVHMDTELRTHASA